MDIGLGILGERLVGALITATSCAGLFWKLDDGISEEAKVALGKWLQRLKIQHTAPNAAHIFECLINRVFGESHFSVRCLFRSCVISIIFAITVYALLILNFGFEPGLLRAGGKYSDFWVTTAVTLTWNIVADYVSLLKSRIIIFYMSTRKYILSLMFLYMSDLIITVFIFAIVFQVVLQAVPQILLGAGYAILYDREPIYQFYFMEAPEATLALFITTFFTSIWALIYALSLSALRLTGYLQRAFNFSLWLLPVSTKPIRAIGLSAAAISFLLAIVFPGIMISLQR